MIRSSYSNFQPSDSTPIVEKRYLPQDTEEGKLVIEHEVDVTSPDAVASLPTSEEYTLDNLMRAGVPLEEVPSQVLTPSDVDTVNSALSSALDSLTPKNEE